MIHQATQNHPYQIKKQTKDPEAVVRLTDDAGKKYSKGSISTGSISLDSAIGIGGVPRGKIAPKIKKNSL